MGGLACELVVTRSVRDTAAVLDAVARHGAGRPLRRARPEPARTSTRSGADAGPLRIGVMTDEPGRRGRRPPRLRRRRRRRPAGCSSRSATTSRSRTRRRSTTPTTPGTSSPTGRPGAAWNLDYWSAAHRRRRSGPTTSSRSPGRSPRSGRSSTAADWLCGPRVAAGQQPARSPAGGPRATTCCSRPTIAEPPPPLGTFDSPPDNPLHGLFRAAEVVPFTPPFNVTGQPGHLAAAALERRRPARSACSSWPPFGREDLLLRVAAQLEAAQPWADRRPAGPRLSAAPSPPESPPVPRPDGRSHPHGRARSAGPSAASRPCVALLGLIAYVFRVIWPPLILAGAIVFLLNPVVTRLQAPPHPAGARHRPVLPRRRRRSRCSSILLVAPLATRQYDDLAERVAGAAGGPRGATSTTSPSGPRTTSGRSGSPPARSSRTSSPPRTRPTRTATASISQEEEQDRFAVADRHGPRAGAQGLPRRDHLRARPDHRLLPARRPARTSGGCSARWCPSEPAATSMVRHAAGSSTRHRRLLPRPARGRVRRRGRWRRSAC